MKLILNLLNLLIFFFVTLLSSLSIAFSDINENPLKADLHFFPSAFVAGASIEVIIEMQIDHNYKVYADSIKLRAIDYKDLVIGSIKISPTIHFRDNITKKNREGIEKHAVLKAIVEVPTSFNLGKHEIKMELSYQACTKKYCLFPKILLLKSSFELLKFNNDKFSRANVRTNDRVDTSTDTSISTSTGINSFISEVITSSSSKILPKGSFVTFFIVFLAGILTSFTPCIFPMIPITLTVLGSRKAKSHREAFFISCSYVFGIAITYSLLGLIAAKTGALFGSFIGHPIVIISVACIFILVALSLFDVFTIQTPAFLNQYVYDNFNFKNSSVSKFLISFISGLFAGLIASPCVGPVLVGILILVAKTQSLIFGFSLLFTFAMGFGIVFLILGTFSSLLHKLPKSGPWMKRVSTCLGIIFIVYAIYIILPLISFNSKNKISVVKNGITNNNNNNIVGYWQSFSPKQLKLAHDQGKGVVIDFFADWCVVCKELEIITLQNKNVANVLSKFVLLKVNATKNSKELQELQKTYHIMGLPTLIFINKRGEVRWDLTLTGFEMPTNFISRLNKVDLNQN